jgi:phosphotransferase system  glucose/maltose/N-acetylglucosamine-specific IIC component
LSDLNLSEFGPNLNSKKINDLLNHPSSEFVSYLFAIIGVFGDQITTRLSIMKYNIIESNPLARMLIEHNMWLVFDVLILLIMIGITHTIVKKQKTQSFSIMLTFPFILGFFRLIASIWNLQFLISI